jgi:hypothetical protein
VARPAADIHVPFLRQSADAPAGGGWQYVGQELASCPCHFRSVSSATQSPGARSYCHARQPSRLCCRPVMARAAADGELNRWPLCPKMLPSSRMVARWTFPL